MIFTPKQIDEIAQEIEGGMKVYINLITREIKTTFDWEEEQLEYEGFKIENGSTSL